MESPTRREIQHKPIYSLKVRFIDVQKVKSTKNVVMYLMFFKLQK